MLSRNFEILMFGSVCVQQSVLPPTCSLLVFYFSSAAVAAAAVARLVSSAETTHTHMQTFFLPNK